LRFKITITTIIILLVSLILGCASSSIIITGNIRPAIDPSEVMLFLDYPSKYETIGMVEASSDIEISSQAAMDRVINELKKQAAKIGANGLILLNTGTDSNVATGVSLSGDYYTSTSETKIAQAKVIYIIKE